MRPEKMERLGEKNTKNWKKGRRMPNHSKMRIKERSQKESADAPVPKGVCTYTAPCAGTSLIHRDLLPPAAPSHINAGGGNLGNHTIV